MSQLDLNKPTDFARATMGSVGGLLQTLDLAGRNPEQWDLLEGSYNGVVFHVLTSKQSWNGALGQIQDSGGRRKAKFLFPYRDGQTTDDMGSKPETFEADIVIHGPQYLKGLQALFAEFNKPTPGVLIHPVRGAMTVAVEEFQTVHSNDKRKAAQIRVTFIQHSFTIGTFRPGKDPSVKGALSSALDAFNKINDAITAVSGAVSFAQSFKNQVVQALNDFANNFAATLQSLNISFNTRGSTDIPGLLPVNSGGTGTPGNGASFPLAGTPIDDITTTTIPALAASDMTKLVNQRRQELTSILTSLEGADPLGMHDTILDLKTTGILLQDVLEKGIASSRAQVIDYMTPRTMSLREVAFANGIDVGKSIEIAQLNPALESVNMVLKGTTVRVPVS